jgi:hypothetical protein
LGCQTWSLNTFFIRGASICYSFFMRKIYDQMH